MCTFGWGIQIQSWSDYLVFETDEKVAKVKNRLNMMAANALEEVAPSKHIHGQSRSSYGFGVESETSELRGVPTFPIPRRRSVMLDGSELGYKWESWIYAEIGGGIEITFLDPTGSGFFDFAPIPPNSPNHALWSRMAPETVVARVVSQRLRFMCTITGAILWIFICTRQISANLSARQLWRRIWVCQWPL